MSLFRRGGPGLPDTVSAALHLDRGERVLADGVDGRTGAHIVLTTYRLLLVDPAEGSVRIDRPWHDVAAGAWVAETDTLQVTWADGTRPAEWSVGTGQARLADVFRDRVSASVVLAEPLQLDGALLGQGTIRRDLRTGELSARPVLRKGVRPTDPAVAAYLARAMADLAEQVGLEPDPGDGSP